MAWPRTRPIATWPRVICSLRGLGQGWEEADDVPRLVQPSWEGKALRPFDQEVRYVVSRITVNVSNNGLMDVSNSIFLFHECPSARIDGVPLRLLVGFEKVFVRAILALPVKFDMEKWMAGQGAIVHMITVGPGMRYVLRICTSDSGTAAKRGRHQ